MEGGREAWLGSDSWAKCAERPQMPGRGPSLTGRATAGSMVRQRSMRRTPLIKPNSSMVGWDGGGTFSAWSGLVLLSGLEITPGVVGYGLALLSHSPERTGVQHAT